MKSLPKSRDARDLVSLLKKENFRPDSSLERQIASHVRDLIQENKIPVKTKLPALRSLAELWETNYSTVQNALSTLAAEGLILQTPKLGTFVAHPRRILQRVCLYHDHTLNADSHQDFFSSLNIKIYAMLSMRGIVTVPLFDRRPFPQLRTAPPELREMVRDGKVDAVIATGLLPEHSPWLLKLGVPVASPFLSRSMPECAVEIDYTALAQLAVQEAVDKKRKKIGLIHYPPEAGSDSKHSDLLRSELERLAAAKGIAVVCPEDTFPIGGLHLEQFGFQLCQKLLKSKSPPDLIFVYPDLFVRGVVTALLKAHSRVPADIMLVSHRNAESSIYLPFPVTWLTVKIEDFAKGLISQIERQIAGKAVKPVMIPVTVERSSLSS